MLPRPHRLRASAEFRQIISSGKRVRGKYLLLHLTTRDAPDQHQSGHTTAGAVAAPVKIGFIVSKAVGNAVVRNRTKRRLRHIVGDRLDQLEAAAGVVVRALPQSGTATFAQLSDDFDRILKKA